jgi:hypothetical protein
VIIGRWQVQDNVHRFVVIAIENTEDAAMIKLDGRITKVLVTLRTSAIIALPSPIASAQSPIAICYNSAQPANPLGPAYERVA